MALFGKEMKIKDRYYTYCTISITIREEYATRTTGQHTIVNLQVTYHITPYLKANK